MPQQREARTYRFTMVMTPHEREMFEEVAAADQRTVADWIRARMHEAHKKLTKANK